MGWVGDVSCTGNHVMVNVPWLSLGGALCGAWGRGGGLLWGRAHAHLVCEMRVHDGSGGGWRRLTVFVPVQH